MSLKLLLIYLVEFLNVVHHTNFGAAKNLSGISHGLQIYLGKCF
jgi:hypothetical protein